MVGAVRAALETASPKADSRARALAIAAAMIGGVAVVRAASKSRPELSEEILSAIRRVLAEVGGEGGAPRD
jgi:TetR/AcrR family transcriptional regulator, transcriptional repressor for nem operon